jgi:hypothetical protein
MLKTFFKYAFMKRILLILTVLYTCRAGAQNTSKEHLDSLVNSFVAELRGKGVDTLLTFEDYWTPGQAFIGSKSDWCESKSTYVPVYFLWKQNGKTYLSKKDNCFDFSTAEVYATSIWQYYMAHDREIKKEKNKPFQIATIVNGKTSITTVGDENPGRRNLKLMMGNDSIIKRFDTFQLLASTKNGSETLTNANYQNNISQLSKKLVDMLGDFMFEADKKKVLTRLAR